VKVLLNSTHSSLVDYGLTNSQFADLSSVEEDDVEESKQGTCYQDLGEVPYGCRRVVAAGPGQHQGDRRARKGSATLGETRRLVSPFEAPPGAQGHEETEHEDVVILQEGDPISKGVQHYFIDKKHLAEKANPRGKKCRDIMQMSDLPGALQLGPEQQNQVPEIAKSPGKIEARFL